MKKTTYLLPVVVLAIAGLLSSIFIVDERENALVLQFGRVVAVKEDPGLAFKIPLIQEVVRYDDRILSRDIDPLEITPLDDRRLVVDAFARYRIADVNQFRQAVGVGGIATAESRLDSILRAETREVLGSVSSNDILSSDRAALMLRIRNAAIAQARALGLEVVDVRLKATDLPPQNWKPPLSGCGQSGSVKRPMNAPVVTRRHSVCARKRIVPLWSLSPRRVVRRRSPAVKRTQSATQSSQKPLAKTRSSLNSTGL